MNKNEMNREYLGMATREIPHDLQAEEAVIGCMLVGGADAVNVAQAMLTEKEFFIPAHRIIFSAILSGQSSGKVYDLVTLTTALADAGLLEEVGGGQALTRMFLLVPTAIMLAEYAQTVREKYMLRCMIEGAGKIMADAYDPTGSEQLTEKIDFAQKFFTDLALSLSTRGAALLAASKTIPEAHEEILAIYHGRGGTHGLDTGIYGLDRMTGGLKPGQVITLAARPSNGKSALAMNIAEHVAAETETPVAVFSLEMSSSELAQRLIISRSRVDIGILRTGFMKGEMHDGLERLSKAAGRLAEAPIYIDDTPGLRLFELIARARRAVVTHKVGLIIIDYLQLMSSGTKRGLDNRVLEISELTGGIKKLARELRVPIIILAQLSRRAEDRPRGIPRLADLRESGSIEQDSDIVLFIHRPERYEENEEQREAIAGTANLIVAKQRNGPTTDNEGIPLVFLKSFVRFENHVDEKYWSNNPAHRQKNFESRINAAVRFRDGLTDENAGKTNG